MHRRRFVSLLAAVLGGSASLSAQGRQERPPVSPLVRPTAVPNPLRRAAEALGDRVFSVGKERYILNGTITDSRGRKSDGQALFEFPAKVRLEQTGGSLSFDGEAPSKAGGALNAEDRRILESLAEDTPEAFFSSLQDGASIRLIGGRFRTDDGKTPNYQGPWLSAYAHAAPSRTAEQPTLRNKQFLFDSVTGLLYRVRYVEQIGGSPVDVVTQFTWMDVDGQRLPKSITRTEGGVPVFEFAASGASVGPRVDDGTFSSGK